MVFFIYHAACVRHVSFPWSDFSPKTEGGRTCTWCRVETVCWPIKDWVPGAEKSETLTVKVELQPAQPCALTRGCKQTLKSWDCGSGLSSKKYLTCPRTDPYNSACKISTRTFQLMIKEYPAQLENSYWGHRMYALPECRVTAASPSQEKL